MPCRFVRFRLARGAAIGFHVASTNHSREGLQMKSKLTLAVALAALLFALPATAEDSDAKPREAKPAAHDKEGPREEPAEGSQQHKMKVCNVEAGKKQLKGDERRAFMSSCLKH
jgi:hypothetical protein